MSDLPAQRHELRASDADRDRTAEVLRDAFGQGRITVAEMEERLTLVYAAKTYAELEPITRDLPEAGAAAPSPAPGAVGYRIGDTPNVKFSVAIMGGAGRHGAWVVPRHYTAFALMGGVELDLREASFAEREVTIEAFTIMGGICVIVPEDIEVVVSGFGLMGGVDHDASGPGKPGAPRVRVNAFALMGGIEVKRKPPKGTKKRVKDRARQPELED
jgi:Domain of unknown function (DUF1707)/Cell wall-active antibiotics response 4TMS YvqF